MARPRTPDSEPIDPPSRGLILPRRTNDEAGTQPLQARQGQVVGDVQPHRESLSGAVLAEHSDTLFPAHVRRKYARVHPDSNLPALDRAQSKNGPQQPGATRAEQPGDPEHLSPMDGERRRAGNQIRHLEQRQSDRARRVGIQILDRASDHQVHDVGRTGL